MGVAPHTHVIRSLDRMPGRAVGGVRQVRVTWNPGDVDTDHFRVHVSPAGASMIPASRLMDRPLLAETTGTQLTHTGLGPAAERWEYVVVAVDGHGEEVACTDVLRARTAESVTVRGRSIGQVGEFDGSTGGFALGPSEFVRYQSRFPSDVEMWVGRDRPELAWSAVHPGPEDAWAGRRPHRFRLHFELAEEPRDDAVLAVWLADRHPTRAATIGLVVNGHRLSPLLVSDADAADDAAASLVVPPGRGAGPVPFERHVPAEVLRRGENVVDLVKDQGSWVAYDAVGLFAAPERIGA